MTFVNNCTSVNNHLKIWIYLNLPSRLMCIQTYISQSSDLVVTWIQSVKQKTLLLSSVDIWEGVAHIPKLLNIENCIAKLLWWIFSRKRILISYLCSTKFWFYQEAMNTWSYKRHVLRSWNMELKPNMTKTNLCWEQNNTIIFFWKFNVERLDVIPKVVRNTYIYLRNRNQWKMLGH